MTSLYTNQANVNIAEIARLQFYEMFNGEAKLIVSLSLNVDFLKNIHETIGTTLEQHAENLKKLDEQTKKMN